MFEQFVRPIASLPHIPAIEQVAGPNASRQVAVSNASRRRILDTRLGVILDDDDDDDNDATKQASKNPPLIDLTNNGGSKPKAKVR